MRLSWDIFGSRKYEVGVDRGVVYPSSGGPVVWNGLMTVTERSGSMSITTRYFDGGKYATAIEVDSFSGSITALTYPPAVDDDIFGLCYRVMSPTDEHPDGYKLHLVYNISAEPTDRVYSTLRDTVNVEPFAWEFTTEPIRIPGRRPTAHIIVDATKAYAWVVEAFENVVYGDAFTEPRLPSPEEIAEIFEAGSILRVIDHGDGTWTATGPDSAIGMIEPHIFQISWPSAVIIDENEWKISSL